MKKLILGFAFYLYVFFVLAYSRRWFFRDWVINRKEVSEAAGPWFLVAFLSAWIVLCCFYLFSRPWVKQTIVSFVHWIEALPLRQWILWVLLASIAVRLFWFYINSLAMGKDFFAAKVISKTVKYHLVMAEQILSGQGFSWNGQPISMRPPGYAFVEAVLFSFFGIGNPWPIILFNNLCGILLVFCAYGIGKALFNELAGRLTALLSIFSWHDLFFSNILIEDFLFTFLFILIVYFIVSRKNSFYVSMTLGGLILVWTSFVFKYFLLPSILAFALLFILILLSRYRSHWRHAAGIGLLLGLTSYVRPPLLLMPFILPVVYKLQGFSLKSGIRNSVVVFLVMLATLSPWILRNSLANGRFTSLSTTGGQTFLEDTEQICPKDAEFLRFKSLRKDDLTGIYFMIIERRKDTIGINQSAVDKQLFTYALKCILRNPIGYLKMAGKRALQLLLNADQVLLNIMVKDHIHLPTVWGGYLTAQLLNVIAYTAILLLAGIGIFHAFQNQRRHLVGFMFLFYYSALLVFLFNPLNRYRIPIWTFLYLYAADGMMKLLKKKLDF